MRVITIGILNSCYQVIRFTEASARMSRKNLVKCFTEEVLSDLAVPAGQANRGLNFSITGIF